MLIFCAIWTKNTIYWKFWENFQKNFLWKLLKMHYFAYLWTKFNKPCVNFFARLDEKYKLLEILRNFSKIFKKLLKMHYFCINFTIFSKPCVNFSRVWTKTQIVVKFWKFYRKIDFLFYFLENFLIKIEPSEITPFFYNNFFSFGGGYFFPLPPGYALVHMVLVNNENVLKTHRKNSYPGAIFCLGPCPVKNQCSSVIQYVSIAYQVRNAS